MIRRWLLGTFASLLLALPLQAAAERYEQFGDYQVHYNAIGTAMLEPDVARSYGIVRSRNRGLITVAVLRDGEPVAARVRAETVNMQDQLRRIAMKEVQEGQSVYYIGTFNVDHLEKLRFRLDVTPRGADRELELVFDQRFYTED